jgi:DnaJ-class molecular chaperone
MGKDYYKILDLSREANLEDVSKAFRRLSLRHHPMKNPTDMATNSYRFAEICESYEVLSNSKLALIGIGSRKAIFDKYGEDVLKDGLPDANGSKVNLIAIRITRRVQIRRQYI